MIDFAWFVTVSVIALPLALGGLAVWAENGTSYRLVEVAGGWLAGEYVPAAEAVPLAASGESVTLQRLDPGGYAFMGRPFVSGGSLALADARSYLHWLGLECIGHA